MFEQTFVGANAAPARRAWTALGSTCLQLALLALWGLASMLHYDILPRTTLQMFLATPAPPAGPPPAPAAQPQVAAPTNAPPKLSDGAHVFLTRSMPPHPEIITDVPEIGNATGSGPFVPGALPPDGALGATRFTPPNVAPPAPTNAVKEQVVERPKETTRLKVSGGVQQAMQLYAPSPVYPPLAIQTRTQGTVVLSAVIARDGTVQSLNVVSGHPLLTAAAVAAVRQWRYRPTLLTGEPVEVVTTIEVHFTLGR